MSLSSIELEELRRLQAETCKTFGNPTRLLILEKVWDGKVTYRELLEATGLDKVTLSQNTSFMRRKGILKGYREGGNLVFEVANHKVLKAFQLMREVLLDRIREENRLVKAGSRSSGVA